MSFVLSASNEMKSESQVKGIEQRILKILDATKNGITTEEIAKEVSLTRHTLAKYLEVLRARGFVHFRKLGRTKVWSAVSSDVNVRLLNKDDIPEILKIGKKIMVQSPQSATDYLKETVCQSIEKGDPLLNLGAEIDNKLVGFIIGEIRLWEFGRGEKTGWIKIIFVDPEYQARGIGKKLFQKFIEHLRRYKVNRVRTMVDWYSGQLLAYFKSLGFNILNMLPLEKEL